MLPLLRPQVLLEKLLPIGQALPLQASAHALLFSASHAPSLSSLQSSAPQQHQDITAHSPALQSEHCAHTEHMRTRRRSMHTHARAHALRQYASMPHCAPQQQEAQDHPQQHPNMPHVPPLHTNGLLHLLSARLEDLHAYAFRTLLQQIPRRVAAHASQLQHLIQCLQIQHSSLQQQHHHQRLLSSFRSALEGSMARKLSALGALQRSAATVGASDEGQRVNGASSGAEVEVVHVCKALNNFKLQVDAEAVRFQRALQHCTELAGWWDDPRRVHALDAAMDSHERHGLQGLKLSTADEGSKESSRWSMAGPQGPPGFDPHAPPRPLINLNVPLVPLLQLTAEDTRAFCIEKNSTAPEVMVIPAPGTLTQPPTSPTNSNTTGDNQYQYQYQQQQQQQQQQQEEQQCVPVVLDAYVEHVFSELLKNAMQALIAKWGAWDVDEADPILVEVDASQCCCSSSNSSIRTSTSDCSSSSSSSSRSGSSSSSSNGGEGNSSGHRDVFTEGPFFSIRITDTGGGIPSSKLHSLQHYFGTTHAPREATYGYSRDFGAKFQGQGVGAPLSRLYARFMGGSLQWAHVLEDGKEVPLDLDQVTEGCGAGIGSNRVDGNVVGTRIKLQLPCHGFSF